MTYEDILVSVEDGVATVTINRPENANKLRFQTARELLEASETFAKPARSTWPS